jgi:hypothetical protein
MIGRLRAFAFAAIASGVTAREGKAMAASIRAAAAHDVPGIVALLTREAELRAASDPALWHLAADAPMRIERAVGETLKSARGSAREFWLVVESAGQLVGVTHAMLVPVPPIYDPVASSPGLILDDCFILESAPYGTAEALLGATEAALRSAGASALIASCPAPSPLHTIYEGQDYEPVTLYLAKHRLSADALPPSVRPATAADVPDIVTLSAGHRQRLAELNPRFWRIHPEADRRFDAWMRRSLTLDDRDMFVSAGPGGVHGYIIAQPSAPLLVPIMNDPAKIGVVDDYYDGDFATVSATTDGHASATNLLAAAEIAFARRGIESALVVCPAAWISKRAVLAHNGYRTAKLWMLKR